MKINNFRGEVTEISATKEPLGGARAQVTEHMFWIEVVLLCQPATNKL